MEISLLVAILTAILGPIIVIRYKTYLIKKNKKEDPLVTSIESNHLIDEQLKMIKEKFGACRVWVSQFHNGGHFFPTGRSISKFSITFEHTNPNLESLSDIYKNIPVSLFNESFKELYEKSNIIIHNFDEDKNFGLSKYNNNKTIKSLYNFALKTVEDDFIGVLGIEFIENDKNLNDGDLQYLKDKAIAIGSIIGAYLYHK